MEGLIFIRTNGPNRAIKSDIKLMNLVH